MNTKVRKSDEFFIKRVRKILDYIYLHIELSILDKDDDIIILELRNPHECINCGYICIFKEEEVLYGVTTKSNGYRRFTASLKPNAYFIHYEDDVFDHRYQYKKYKQRIPKEKFEKCEAILASLIV